ncbi:MAG: hypothetical protein QOJ29_2262 [Thermoleophilaceae bacterium]|nr:hypothetical protein [Thermoleophilaceae bacterium]
MTRIVASAFAVTACLAALLAVVLRQDDRPRSAGSSVTGLGPDVIFEANGGRTDPSVDFLTRGRDFSLFLTRGTAVLRARRGRREAVVRTSLVGAAAPRGVGERRKRGHVNVLRGSEPSKWRTGIPTFGRVRYAAVYPGIDLLYHGRQGKLEYDFQVAPGADPGDIAISVEGGRVRVGHDGSLAIQTPAGVVRQLAPVAYQPGGRKVQARWRVDGRTARFDLGSYDRARPLVIDPVLGYGTFAGGGASDHAYGIEVDADGNAYLTGTTLSDDFPSAGAIQSHQDSQYAHNDVFVTKLAAGGGSFLYSTYLGGTGNDTGNALALATDGGAVVVGQTDSTDFPTAHPLTGTARGTGGSQEAFVARLTPNGDGLVYSTLFGGTGVENAADVVLDGTDDPYFVGVGNGGTGFPVGTTAGYQSTPSTGPDAFLAKLTWNGSALTNAYSTLYGGTGTYPNGSDSAAGVVLGINGHVYMTGTTYSTAFPTTSGVITPTDPDNGTYPSGADGFLVDFDLTPPPATSTRAAATYLGGSGADSIAGVDRDKVSGSLLVVGQTNSNTLPNPDTTGGFTRAAGTGTIDGWIGWVGDDLTSANNYWVGGNAADTATGVHVVQDGLSTTMLAYVAGTTASNNFSVTDSPAAASTNASAYVVKFSSGSRPLSAILGPVGSLGGVDGLAVDALGSAYVAGTAYEGFPTTSGSAQPSSAGPVNNPGPSQTVGPDAFVARLDLKKPVLTQKPAAIISTGSATFQLSGKDTNASYQCSGKTGGGTLTGPGTCTPDINNKVMYSDLAEGPQKFQARAKDDLGAFSPTTTYDFVVDLNPPGAIELESPAAGAQTAEHSPQFSWKEPTDATTVTYQLTIDGTADAVTPTCSGGVCSFRTSRVLGNGPHPWSVRATDAVARSTDSAQRTFTVADPPTAKFSIAPNPVLVGRSVTFDGSGSTDASHPISRYEWDLDGDGSFETDGGASPTTGRAYAAPQDVNIQLRVTGDTGLTSTVSQVLRVTAGGTIPTQLGVTINNGAQYTRTPDVEVSVSSPPTITQMLFSNDGGFLAPTVFAPQKSVKWKLDSSGPERLPKQIYVRFLTGPFASETFQDDIILDEIPPKVEQASVAPAAARSSRASVAAAKAKRWKLRLKATDSNSGVAGVQITPNKKKPGKVLNYKTRLTIKAAGRKLWVRAIDRAGNVSAWRAAKSASKRLR